MFYKSESGSEKGTTRASLNRTGKTNAASGPKKKYNEYKEFHQCEVEGHVCAAFMEMSGMTKPDGKFIITYCNVGLTKFYVLINIIYSGSARLK
jgi:hypothetical protein